jgi:hypothetical protein
MEALYTNIHGETLTHAQWNKHHVFPRCRAKGMGGKVHQFINQRGLVLPMVKGIHVELHKKVDFPPIPSLTLVYRINGFMSDLDTQNPYDRFLALTEHITHVAETTGNTSHREQCERIAENLAQQSVFILEGQVTIVPLQEAA